MAAPAAPKTRSDRVVGSGIESGAGEAPFAQDQGWDSIFLSKAGSGELFGRATLQARANAGLF